MDSSVTGTYTEKKPPRRKAPVRKPRAKKEANVMPVIKSLISPVEREAIKAGQARIVAGETINSAIKGAIARRAVKNARASNPTPKSKNEIVPKSSKISYETIIKNITDNNEFNSLGLRGAKLILKKLVYNYNNDIGFDKVNYLGTNIDFGNKMKDILKGAYDNEIGAINLLDNAMYDELKYLRNKIPLKSKNAGGVIAGLLKRKLTPSLPKPKNEIVPKNDVPVPKPKKERKAKPVYKMSYATAVKAWNQSRGEMMYCNPKKGSPEYNEVQALRL